MRSTASLRYSTLCPQKVRDETAACPQVHLGLTGYLEQLVKLFRCGAAGNRTRHKDGL
jgi:hypothetical protein